MGAPNELGPDEHGRKWDQLKAGKQLFSGRDPSWRQASEYGGVDGLIQPPPHDPADSAYEQLLLIRNMDPGARGDEPDAVELPEGLVEPQMMRKYGG